MRSTKKSRAFDPIGEGSVATAFDQLFGTDQWVRPRHAGNVLITMPNAAEWRVPDKIWHSDFQATLPPDRLVAVKLWSVCDVLEPGGGTPLLAGSHNLFARYLQTSEDTSYKAAKFGFLRSHPWLRALTHDDGDQNRNERFLRTEADIGGLPARIIEVTGQPGDVFVTHAWVYHSIAVSAADRPRLMRATAIVRADPESTSPARG